MEDSMSSLSSVSSSSSSAAPELCPGPTGLPVVGSMLEWEGPQTNLAWTKQYGPIYQVKMGPKNLLYLNSIELVEKYLEGKSGEKFLGRPMGPAAIGEGLLFGSGDSWRNNKRAFMKALHTATFSDHMEASIQSEIHNLVEALNTQTKSSTKIGDVLMPACTNSIAGLLLGGTLPTDSPDRHQLYKVGRDLEGVDLNSMRTKIALKFPSLREPMSKIFFKEIVDFHGISRRLQRLLRQWIRQCRNGTLTPSHVPYTSKAHTKHGPPKPPRQRIPADVLLNEDQPTEQSTSQPVEHSETLNNVPKSLGSSDPNSINKSSESIDTIGASSSEESLLTSFKNEGDIDKAIRCSTYYSAFGFSEIAKEEHAFEQCQPNKQDTPVTPLTEFQWKFNDGRMSMNVKEDSILKRIIDQPEFVAVSEDNDQEMIQSLMDMFFGGIAPVLCSLEFTLLHLMLNPGMQELAQREIDAKVNATRHGEITWSMAGEMPYVKACITEGLRVASVTPSSLPHIATEDAEIEGFHVPKDTMVFASIISLHNDPKHYIDPEAFRPQRHLDSKRNFVKPECYRPYGIGARACVGYKMSEMQLFLFLTNILRHFTLRPGKKGVNTETHVRITRRLKDFRCVLEPRDPTHVTQ